MILNISRGTQFQACRQKAFNWDELRLMAHREADPLMIGEAYHIGSEIISKTGNIEEAVQAAEDRFRQRLVGQMILPEEQAEIEREIEFVKHATREWGRHYDRADFKVLWPEVSGCIAIPGTEHHCWNFHRLLHPDIPFEHCRNLADNMELPSCIQPHYLKFRTDGLIELQHKVWLLEQKTTSSTERNNFWVKWNMDFQTRGYVYGIWKVTGLQPAGFLLNAIIKHSVKPPGSGRSGYKMQLDPTNVGFEREAFSVTEEDLLDWEHDFKLIADDYERAFRTGNIYKNTSNCFNYNRKCYYWDLCLRHQKQINGEFRVRKNDYVNDAYYELLGLEKPKEELCQITTSTGAPVVTDDTTVPQQQM